MMLIQKEWVDRFPQNLLVPHYLMASVLYYHYNRSPMTDEAYDRVCQRLMEEWRGIHHPHKKFVSYASLSATTGFNIRAAFLPKIIQIAAFSYMESVENGTIYDDLSPYLVSHGRHENRLPVGDASDRPMAHTPLLRRRRGRVDSALPAGGATGGVGTGAVIEVRSEPVHTKLLLRGRTPAVEEVRDDRNHSGSDSAGSAEIRGGEVSSGRSYLKRRSYPGSQGEKTSSQTAELFPEVDRPAARLVRRVGASRRKP